MKTKLILIPFLLLLTFVGNTQKIKKIRFYNLNEYLPAKTIGEKVSGYKHGKWIKVSDSGTVYGVSHYNMSCPVDTWRINYPNGDLRVKYEYDSVGNLLNWTRYYKSGKKMIDILPFEVITYSSSNALAYFELALFDQESIGIGDAYPINEFQVNTKPIKKSDLLPVLSELVSCKYKGKCNLYYNSGRLAVEATFDDSGQKRNEFYYKKGVLKLKKVFINNVHKKDIIYNKDGSIKKEKKIE